MRILLLLAVLAASGSAQVQSIVGPPVAPQKCPIRISVSNDTGSTVFLSTPCPFAVFDALMKPVFSPICIQVIQDVKPGETFSTSWDQRDDLGNPVAPGGYLVQVSLPGGVKVLHKVEISATVAAAVAPLGVPRVGTKRGLALCAPADGGLLHLLALSLGTSPGLPTCGGLVPLIPDALFALSIAPNPAFGGFFGTLDAGGGATGLGIAYPNNANLVGLSFAAAFVVLDPAFLCPIRRVSAPTVLTIG